MIGFHFTKATFISDFMKIGLLVQKLQPFLEFESLAGISASGGFGGSFWGLSPPKCTLQIFKPSKGTSLRQTESFKPSNVKIGWAVQAVGERRNKKAKPRKPRKERI
jgi:hypothetical protein